MPSAKILEAKKAYVAELNTKIAGSLAGVVVSYNGISVADDTKMRKELREAGVEYMVVKNTMLRRAVAGTQYEAIAEYFKGDTAIALSAEDPAAAARILCKVADADKSKRFTVKGGFCDGQVLDAAGVKSLSTMPNREGLLYAGWLPQRDHRRSGCCDPGDRRQAGRNPRCLIYLAA